MKLYEAIAKINKADIDQCWEIDPIQNALGIEGYVTQHSKVAERLSYVYLDKWLCTDTWVGTKVYFLDGLPLAVSYQSARKSTENVDFISENDVNRAREFVFSCLTEEDSANVLVCNLDSEIGEHYNVEYSGQLLVKKGFYKGQPVEVVKEYFKYEDINLWRFVDVSLNGEVITIPMSEFDIPFNVVE